MHTCLTVYYSRLHLLLLHVTTSVCHPQRALIRCLPSSNSNRVSCHASCKEKHGETVAQQFQSHRSNTMHHEYQQSQFFPMMTQEELSPYNKVSNIKSLQQNCKENYLVFPVEVTELLRQIAIIWVKLLFLKTAIYNDMNYLSLLLIFQSQTQQLLKCVKVILSPAEKMTNYHMSLQNDSQHNDITNDSSSVTQVCQTVNSKILDSHEISQRFSAMTPKPTK